MKKRTMKTKEAIGVLVDRAEARGDPDILKEKISTLSRDLGDSRRRTVDLQKELDYTRGRVEELSEEVRRLEAMGGFIGT